MVERSILSGLEDIFVLKKNSIDYFKCDIITLPHPYGLGFLNVIKLKTKTKLIK
jgi:hypothetical protein